MKPTGFRYDVNFQIQAREPQKGDGYEPICSFEDGYAAFLAPLFEKVNEKAGRTVVFINGATFGGEDLKLLAQIISTARKRMVAKGESWEVFCGYSEVSKGKGQGKRRCDIYSKVTKHKMNLLLCEVETALRRAKSLGAYVRFNFWGGGG